MKKYIKYIVILLIVGIAMTLTGIAYSFFNYTQKGATSEMLVGKIYFNHTQGNTISLEDEFPTPKEVARTKNNNVVTLSITGLNESSRDIYYKLLLVHGPEVSGKSRIADRFLRFDLVEVINNEEKYIVYNESFSTINNTLILRDRILAGTTSNVNRTYKLRMWIDENLLISDTNANRDYTTSQFNNLFATIRVVAKADMQDIKYYSSFGDAVTAINSETYTSTLSRDNAKVGIYTDPDDSSVNLALYDDINLNTSYTITKPVNINLYGNDIEFTKDNGTSYLALTFTNTFSLENGTITNEIHDSGIFPFGVVSSPGGNGVINNIDFPFVSDYNACAVGGSGGDVVIKNSSVMCQTEFKTLSATVKLVNTHLDGYTVVDDATFEIYDSYLEYSHSPQEWLIYTSSTGRVIVNDSTIFADSPGCYWSSTNSRYAKSSTGIINNGTLIFNSGYVFGTHSAVQANYASKTYVYGGTFESTDHGGFYLSHGPSGVAYIENANIRGVSYPSQGQYRPNGTVDRYITVDGVTYELEEAKTAFYIGGSTYHNNESVYMVNCNISAEKSPLFVMRYSAPYQNLYMSGCTFLNTTASYIARIDEPNKMKLYLGYNNNLGLINKFGTSSSQVTLDQAKQAGTIVETYADYKNIVSPS